MAKVAHLAKLQSLAGNKSRITIRIDSDVLAVFKARAEATGGSYQSLMNDALRQFSQGVTLADVVRNTVRESVGEYLVERQPKAPARKRTK